ncbi:MAG: OmpA family protein [Hyphomonadaceae bacterium]
MTRSETRAVENLPAGIEEKMGQTPTFNDRFAPRGAAAKGGSGQDRFAAQAGRAGVVDHFGNVKSATRGDAFAGGGRIAKAAPVDRFGAKPVRADSPPPVEAVVAPPPLPKRTALHVVASQPEIAVSEPVEVKYQDLKREEAWRRKAARTSSLVLVSGAATAADVIDAPPPAPPAPAPKAETPPPPPLLAEKAPPRTGGGGGGGSGAGSGEPPREHGFNQDDFVGVMLGAAVVVLLLLWMLRGGQQQDNQLVGVQSAMNDPIALPAAAPPPAPLLPPDPFGDRAVDLTPKGPIPEPDTSKAAAEAAPAPAAAPVPVGDRAMHAWFCTAGSKLTAASRKTLEGELEQFSAAFAGKELIVRGYADTRGTSNYNSALGGQRATVVADFLRTKGLNVVDAAGVGELTGLDDNQNCSNQRRVDVFVKGGPGEEPSRACAPEPDVEELVCG